MALPHPPDPPGVGKEMGRTPAFGEGLSRGT